MDTKYTALNRYRLINNMSMTDFAKLIGLDYFMVRKTLLGMTEPHDYNRVVFDKYYHEHEDEILSAILEKTGI